MGGWEETVSCSPFWSAESARRIEKLLEEDPDGKTWNPLEAAVLADPTGVAPTKRAAMVRVGQTAKEYGQYTEYIYPMPPVVAELNAILGPNEEEAYVRITTGQDPVSAWDTWVASWKSGGGDEMTEAINQAYEQQGS